MFRALPRFCDLCRTLLFLTEVVQKRRKTEVFCSPRFLTMRDILGLSEHAPGTQPGPSQDTSGMHSWGVLATLPGHCAAYRRTLGPFPKEHKFGHLHEFTFACMVGDKVPVCVNGNALGLPGDAHGISLAPYWNISGYSSDVPQHTPGHSRHSSGTLPGL